MRPEQQPPACATCGERLLPIAYGYPGLDMWEAAERGEIVLGGCTVDPGMPRFTCRSCRPPSDDVLAAPF